MRRIFEWQAMHRACVSGVHGMALHPSHLTKSNTLSKLMGFHCEGCSLPMNSSLFWQIRCLPVRFERNPFPGKASCPVMALSLPMQRPPSSHQDEAVHCWSKFTQISISENRKVSRRTTALPVPFRLSFPVRLWSVYPDNRKRSIQHYGMVHFFKGDHLQKNG